MNRSLFTFAAVTGLLLLTMCDRTIIPEDALVIRNANVVTMDNDEVLYNRTVAIHDGRIVWLGESGRVAIPETATVIEGEYYLMPGLAEMHGHIPGSAQDRQYMEDVLALYITQGVTTLRGMAGNPIHLELREQAARGEIVSPRIFAAGPSFSGGSAPDPQTARERVREQAEAGYDLLKFAPGLTLEVFNAAVEEAHEQGIEFSGHISRDVGLLRTLESGKGTIDHLDRYMEYLAGDAADRDDPPIIWFGYDLTPHVDPARIEEAARITTEAGVGNVPTNTLLENVFNPDLSLEEMQQWPGMEFIPSGTVESWSNTVRNIRADDAYDPDQARRFLDIRKQLTTELYRHGPDLLLLGADSPQVFNPPGYSIHRELEVKVDGGLTPYEALRTGTVNVGTYLGEEYTSGKVLPGFRADLILLSVNPLETLPFCHAIEGVIYDGNYLGRSDLDGLLEQMRRRAN